MRPLRSRCARFARGAHRTTSVRIPHEMFAHENMLREAWKAKRAGHRRPARFAMQDPP
jgi:hypothetical protein